MSVSRQLKQKSCRGQSLVEIAVTLPFLVALVIAVVEMGIIFTSYLSLVNATREGAIFASMYPELTNPANDSKPYGSGNTLWGEYTKRVADEILVVVGEPLREGLLLNESVLTIDRPTLGPTSTDCPTALEIGCPITVTTHYRVRTFTSDMSLPYFGRLGLPSLYQVDYSMGMPIR